MALNFKALTEEFQRTNWKDPGTWHAAPKILVLLAILIGIPVGGFFGINQGQLEAPRRIQPEALGGRGYSPRRRRPLARRLRNTLRPPGVRLRTRKP